MQQYSSFCVEEPMVQSESNNKQSDSTTKITPPQRRFTLELLVGLFTILGVVCAGLLAIGLGGQKVFGSNQNVVYAEFDNIAGLQKGASVEVGGVPVGEVTDIQLNDPYAKITMLLHSGFQIRDDDIAMIRTKGIIGDRYVKISRGGSDILLKPGTKMSKAQTESVVDIEDIIGNIVHKFSGEKSSDTKSDSKKE